jgi:hypothetical protein
MVNIIDTSFIKSINAREYEIINSKYLIVFHLRLKILHYAHYLVYYNSL